MRSPNPMKCPPQSDKDHCAGAGRNAMRGCGTWQIEARDIEMTAILDKGYITGR
jgi:hypothetical protein